MSSSPSEQSSSGQQSSPEGLLSGSQPLAQPGSDAPLAGPQPLAQVKRKRTRGGRIERARREAKLRTAALRADEAGATATHDRLSSAAAAHADAARRAHYAQAKAHRVALEYFAAAEAATTDSGMVQIGTQLGLQAPAAAYSGQHQVASIVALATQAADIIAAVTEAAAIIAAASRTNACAASAPAVNAGTCTCAAATSAAAAAAAAATIVTGQAEKLGQAAAAGTVDAAEISEDDSDEDTQQDATDNAGSQDPALAAENIAARYRQKYHMKAKSHAQDTALSVEELYHMRDMERHFYYCEIKLSTDEREKKEAEVDAHGLSMTAQEIVISKNERDAEVFCIRVKAKAEEVCDWLAQFSDECEWCVAPTNEEAHCFP